MSADLRPMSPPEEDTRFDNLDSAVIVHCLAVLAYAVGHDDIGDYALSGGSDNATAALDAAIGEDGVDLDDTQAARDYLDRVCPNAARAMTALQQELDAIKHRRLHAVARRFAKPAA